MIVSKPEIVKVISGFVEQRWDNKTNKWLGQQFYTDEILKTVIVYPDGNETLLRDRKEIPEHHTDMVQ